MSRDKDILDRRFGVALFGEVENWSFCVLTFFQCSGAFPTAGIATTPHFDRAKFYALGGQTHSVGFVYKLDRELFASNGVREFIVAQYTVHPAVPQDDDVILVASELGELPDGIIVEVLRVTNST